MIFTCDYAFAEMKKNWQEIFNAENPFFINANLVFIKTCDVLKWKWNKCHRSISAWCQMKNQLPFYSFIVTF